MARSSERHCPPDFTCFFNWRPRQEAGPHKSAAVATATPLLIVAHPLPESFQWPSEGVGLWSVGGKKRREAVCLCVCVFLGEQQAAEVWVEVLKDFD